MNLISTRLTSYFKKVQLSTILVITIGMVLGLAVGELVSIPIEKIDWQWIEYVSLAITAITVIIFTGVFYVQKEVLVSAFNRYWPFGREDVPEVPKKARPKSIKKSQSTPLLLDSSAIIDGRIADIARTGFIEGELIVINSILAEIKRIADSKDPLKKQRGKRALEILDELRKGKYVPFKYVKEKKEDMEGLDVDERLSLMAMQLNGKVVTTDYNLQKKAKIMGLTVLNVNELANMVKTILLPGEQLAIEIIQEGKGDNQGIGYLPDGTMVVVENGSSHIGDHLTVRVERLLQTEAGRMVFTKPVESN